MTLWRLEWLRLTRTRRGLGLLAAFVFFGFSGPLLAVYAGKLLGSSTSGNLHITVSAATPADAIGGYAKNALQLGVVVAVVLAAAALAIDARPGLATFYRTRVARTADLLVPRFAVVLAATLTAYTTGLLVALYETVLLVRAPGAGAMLAGWGYGCAFLLAALSLTALSATVARGTAGTAGIALLLLLIPGMLGVVPGADRWLPTALAGAPDALLRNGSAADYAPAAAMAVAVSAVALTVALRRAGRRELTPVE